MSAAWALGNARWEERQVRPCLGSYCDGRIVFNFICDIISDLCLSRLFCVLLCGTLGRDSRA